LKARAETLKRETYALYLACRDPRVSWPAKLVVALVVAYALSPIDLIPDFIPVLGYLDDLLLIPIGITIALRLIPESILNEHRAEATRLLAEKRPGSWLGGAMVLAIWLFLAGVAVAMAFRILGR
jgi:uncharacterized membrane protein YkvA (DUF1232 family)